MPEVGKQLRQTSKTAGWQSQARLDATTAAEKVRHEGDRTRPAILLHGPFEEQRGAVVGENPAVNFGHFMDQRDRLRDALEIATSGQRIDEVLQAGEIPGR